MKKKRFYIDACNLYGYALSENLPYDEIEIWHGHPDFFVHKLEDNLNTKGDNDIGYFVEVDSKYPDNIKQTTKISFSS